MLLDVAGGKRLSQITQLALHQTQHSPAGDRTLPHQKSIYAHWQDDGKMIEKKMSATNSTSKNADLSIRGSPTRIRNQLAGGVRQTNLCRKDNIVDSNSYYQKS